MPLNEAAGYRRSNLTPQQKREQELAIYGVTPNAMGPQLTPEEIQRMRAILLQHDAKNVLKEFDPHNPPKVPYRYQEYPRVMYHHDLRKSQVAHDEQAVAEAEAAGWSKEPFPAEVEEPALDASSAAEVAILDRKLREKRK